MMNRIVGTNMKVLRKLKKMTQEEAADQLGISQPTYARIERGESSSWAVHLKGICKVFQTTPEEMVRKELQGAVCESLVDAQRQTEIAMLGVYRKIIKKQEQQIQRLKMAIMRLEKEKA